MTEILYTIGDALMVIAALGAFAFAVSYASFFDWRKTPAGRALLFFVVSLIVVFLNNTAARLIGSDYPFREWVRLAVYTCVAFTIWRLVRVLWANWRTDTPPLDIPARQPTKEGSAMNTVKTPFTKSNKLYRAVASAFDVETRQRIQMFFASLAPILVGLGLASTAETEQWLILSAAAMQAIAGLLNLVNLRGLWNIWTALRGIVYTLATTAAPTLTVLGYVDDAMSATILTGLSLGLSSLSALVAIFASKDQQAAKKVAEAVRAGDA